MNSTLKACQGFKGKQKWDVAISTCISTASFGSSNHKCCLFFKMSLHSSFSIFPDCEAISLRLSCFIPVFITVCLHSGVHTLPSLSFIPVPPPPTPPHTFMACFCSVSGLWCYSNAHKITLTFSLSLLRCPRHTCALSPPLPPSNQKNIHPPLSLCPLLSLPSPLFEVIRAWCHSSQLLSSHRKKRGECIYALLEHSHLSSCVKWFTCDSQLYWKLTLNKQPLVWHISSKLTVTVTENVGLIVPLQIGDPFHNEVSLSQKQSCLAD